jgi:hypothetical protein
MTAADVEPPKATTIGGGPIGIDRSMTRLSSTTDSDSCEDERLMPSSRLPRHGFHPRRIMANLAALAQSSSSLVGLRRFGYSLANPAMVQEDADSVAVI